MTEEAAEASRAVRTGSAVEEGLERLASCLALLVSDKGEADNAARAVGQTARRLGLSGGQLKAIFMAGVRAAGVQVAAASSPDGSDQAAALARVTDEAADLRRLLDRSDAELRSTQRRLAILDDVNEELRGALDRRQTGARVGRVAAAVVVAACLAAGGFAWFAPRWHLGDGIKQADLPLRRTAVVGASGAHVYRQLDPVGQPVTSLPPGARVPVNQLLWHGFGQWVETELDGRAAYVAATEVDLQ